MGRPDPEVGQDLLDDFGLLDERDDPQCAATAWTDEGIHLVHLLDDLRPRALRRGDGELTETRMVRRRRTGEIVGVEVMRSIARPGYTN